MRMLRHGSPKCSQFWMLETHGSLFLILFKFTEKLMMKSLNEMMTVFFSHKFQKFNNSQLQPPKIQHPHKHQLKARRPRTPVKLRRRRSESWLRRRIGWKKIRLQLLFFLDGFPALTSTWWKNISLLKTSDCTWRRLMSKEIKLFWWRLWCNFLSEKWSLINESWLQIMKFAIWLHEFQS